MKEEKNPLDELEEYIQIQTVETKSLDIKGEKDEKNRR